MFTFLKKDIKISEITRQKDFDQEFQLYLISRNLIYSLTDLFQCTDVDKTKALIKGK